MDDDLPLPAMVTAHWLQVRKVGERDWMRLRKYPDEADALVALVEQRAGSQPQWEFRVALVGTLMPVQEMVEA